MIQWKFATSQLWFNVENKVLEVDIFSIKNVDFTPACNMAYQTRSEPGANVSTENGVVERGLLTA